MTAKVIENTVKRYQNKQCCGKFSIGLETNFPLLKKHALLFREQGYSVLDNYLDSGMIYIEDSHLIATASIGSNLLQIRCKTTHCQEFLGILEKRILALPR